MRANCDLGRLAFWRLSTIDHLALLNKSWNAGLHFILDKGVDQPSLIFKWQHETKKEALLIPRIRFATMTYIPEIYLQMTDEQYEVACKIADIMMRCPWKTKQRKGKGSDTLPYAFHYDAGKLVKITNPQSLPSFGRYEFGCWLVRSSSVPICEDTQGKAPRLKRSRSAKLDQFP